MDGELISIAIADTGIGISQEGLAKLFQPFSKVADSDAGVDAPPA